MNKFNRKTLIIVLAILAFALFCRWGQTDDMDIYVEQLKSPSGDIEYACLYSSKADYISVKTDKPMPAPGGF